MLPPFPDLNPSAASQASAADIAGRRLSSNVYPPRYGPRSTGVVSFFDSFPGLNHVLPPFPLPGFNPSAASQAFAAGIAGRRLSSNVYPPGCGSRSIGAVSLFDSFPGSSHVLPPFPSLNPSAASQASAGGISERRLTPKLEVKEEPVDKRRTQDPSNHISLHGGLFDYAINLPPPPPSLHGGLSASAITLPPPPPSFSGEVSAIGSEFGDNRVSTYALPPRPPQRIRRPCELARVTNTGREHREILKRTRMIYDSLQIHLMAEKMKRTEVKPGHRFRADIKASYMMRDRGLWLNQENHIVGAVPGVEIGDIFFHRLEMCVVGLHGHPHAGINYLTANRSSNGEPIATSIVVSGSYEDDEDTGNVLVYAGQGGHDTKRLRQYQDQKLVTGNLAMERSMHYGIEVRVIRGYSFGNVGSKKVYYYDGLYKIIEYWLAEGKSGFKVFKFKLVRIEGQPEMGSVTARLAGTLKSNPSMVRPTGYISSDISLRKENVPVYVYNDLDGDREPLRYSYIAESVYSPEISALFGNNRTGCDCSRSCTEDCFCARKNGGEFAYDGKGYLLRGKPVVFECGISCKCSQSCKNRVTQKGLRNNRLEIFRSTETFWGVRTLDIIQAGEFICEYAGLVVTRSQAEIMSMNGDAMVCPDMFAEKWREWGDLSQVYPDYVRPNYPSLPPLDFRIDVSQYRNVACYISHNRAPNVMAQFVLYDHDHLMYPRVMLFALENIPALTRLSLDYGLADEVNGKLSICN